MKDEDLSPSVAVGIMRAIGDLAEVGGPDIKEVLDQLIPIILSMLQAMSCFAKREVSVVLMRFSYVGDSRSNEAVMWLIIWVWIYLCLAIVLESR